MASAKRKKKLDKIEIEHSIEQHLELLERLSVPLKKPEDAFSTSPMLSPAAAVLVESVKVLTLTLECMADPALWKALDAMDNYINDASRLSEALAAAESSAIRRSGDFARKANEKPAPLPPPVRGLTALGQQKLADAVALRGQFPVLYRWKQWERHVSGVRKNLARWGVNPTKAYHQFRTTTKKKTQDEEIKKLATFAPPQRRSDDTQEN